MKALVICRRELHAYFGSFTAYILLAVFLLLSGYFFYSDLAFFVLFGGANLSAGLWRYVFLDWRLIALLVTLELAADMTTSRAFDEIGRARELNAPDTPLIRFCRALDDAGVLDQVEIAVPGDAAREHQLLALREAVPAGVNARVGRAKAIDARIAKTAADMIVPFDRLGELLTMYDEEFRARGLDAAVWGHISDGNLHPNVIPRSMDEMESGKAAILTFGREVIRLGGSPLAEHGVGRNPVKQQLLLELYGHDGVEQMRAVKRTLDPGFKLAPGVLFRET
jgi:D-lactate dehydrogenase (cytochrome)